MEIGRPGGMRAHTPLRATDFEAVVSTDFNHGTLVPGVGIAPTKSRGLGAVAVLIRALTPAGREVGRDGGICTLMRLPPTGSRPVAYTSSATSR